MKQLWAKSAARAKKLGLKYWGKNDKNGVWHWHDTVTGGFSSGPPLSRDKKGIYHRAGRKTKKPAKKRARLPKKPEVITRKYSDMISERMRRIFFDVVSVVGDGLYSVVINPNDSVDGEVRLPIKRGVKDTDFILMLEELDWQLEGSSITATVLSDIKADEFDIRKKTDYNPTLGPTDYIGDKPMPAVNFHGWWNNTNSVRPVFFLRLYELVESVSKAWGRKIKGVIIRLFWSSNGEKSPD